MRGILKHKRIYIVGLTPLSLLLIILAKNSSFFAEKIYAKHIYKLLSQIISTITGLFPFSIAELIIIALPAIILVIITRFIVSIIVSKGKRIEKLIKGLLNVFCAGSIIFFLFTILAGINYYRYPFGTYSGLEIHESSVEELFALTDSLALEANRLREQISTTDENGVFRLSMSNYELAKVADKAYELLSEDYPILSGFYGQPKPVIFSELMSRTEITGIFIPFTMEANVNVDVPDFTIPSTMLHELAHLRGFMREDEANFLSYLAGMKSDNVEFQYSSTMHALSTAGNELYNQDPDLFYIVRSQYSEEVLKDFRDSNQYWVKYEDTVISTVSNKINDTYLKVNDQSDGVKSYGRMLDLLLAKYRKDHNLDN